MIHGKLCLYFNNIFYEFSVRDREFVVVNSKTFACKIFNSIEKNCLLLIFCGGFTGKKIEKYINKSFRKFIKRNKVEKLVFICEDVFRLEHSRNTNILNTNYITDPDTKALELETIKVLSNNFPQNKTSVFSCEYNAGSIFNKKYNMNIYYFDLFLMNWIGNRYYDIKKYKELELDKINYNISCFNLREDYHRTILGVLLAHESNALVTLHNYFDYLHITNNDVIDINQFSEELKKRLKFNFTKIKDFDLTYDISSKDKPGYFTVSSRQQDLNISGIQKSAINIVTETRYTTPLIYISEKTIKPLMCMRPFIIAGPPYTLRLLKKFGFKTFGDFWDESYDDELDHAKRLEMVYNLSKQMTSKNINELKIMLLKMKDILEYNREQVLKLPEEIKKLSPEFVSVCCKELD